MYCADSIRHIGIVGRCISSSTERNSSLAHRSVMLRTHSINDREVGEDLPEVLEETPGRRHRRRCRRIRQGPWIEIFRASSLSQRRINMTDDMWLALIIILALFDGILLDIVTYRLREYLDRRFDKWL